MEFEDIVGWFCKFCFFLLILYSLNSLFGDIGFRMKYSSAKVSEITENIIDTYPDPIQINIHEKRYIKHKGEKNFYNLQPMAEYSISALVVAKNTNFWFRDIARTSFDDLALLDLGFVWGELAKDKRVLYKHIGFKSHKTLGQARQLSTSFRIRPLPWEYGYIASHLSHTHIIPANTNVMSALLKIKKNDIVKIDGYLVDIYTDKGATVALTSMSRSDTNAQGRGGGACEDMYVTQVQIGNKIYR